MPSHLGEGLSEQSLGKAPHLYKTVLRERMAHVEEELKNQRGFEAASFEARGRNDVLMNWTSAFCHRTVAPALLIVGVPADPIFCFDWQTNRDPVETSFRFVFNF